jgi:hypothetical protein
MLMRTVQELSLIQEYQLPNIWTFNYEITK